MTVLLMGAKLLEFNPNRAGIQFTIGLEDTVSLRNRAPAAELPTEGPNQSQENDEKNWLEQSPANEILSSKSEQDPIHGNQKLSWTLLSGLNYQSSTKTAVLLFAKQKCMEHKLYSQCDNTSYINAHLLFHLL